MTTLYQNDCLHIVNFPKSFILSVCIHYSTIRLFQNQLHVEFSDLHPSSYGAGNFP